MYCKRCRKDVHVYQSGTNNGLNLALTILTCGVWLPIWIFAASTQNHLVCSSCGRPVA